jgi:spore coat polysaccharide biosynthesis protein SpsF
MSEPTLIAIVQGRLNSKRLPNKIILPLAGKPMLWHVLDRVSRSKSIKQIYCTVPEKNTVLDELLSLTKDGMHPRYNDKQVIPRFFTPSEEENVFMRFLTVAKRYKDFYETDNFWICRITADNPLLDYHLIDALWETVKETKFRWSYYYTTYAPTGCNAEIFKASVLFDIQQHVTGTFANLNCYIYCFDPVKFYGFPLVHNMNFSVDTKGDYEKMYILYDELYEGVPIDLRRVVSF